MKTWEVLPLNKDAAAEMAETYGVPFFLAMLLEIRGIREPEQIRGLLQSAAVFARRFYFIENSYK